jgi:uncharacterized protein
MPYKNVSEVPSNVPEAYKKQFMEVWNSAYAAAKADKKSDADAEAWAFQNAHGVVNKHKEKDAKKRDVSSDGPGFGPVEKKGEDGGQVSDPQQLLRYSEDQARDPNGKFASGSQGSHEPDKQAAHKGVGNGGSNQGRAPGIVDSNDKSIEHAQTLHEHINEFEKEGNVNAWAAFKTAANVLGGLKVSKALAENTFSTLSEHLDEAVKESNFPLVHALSDAMAHLNHYRGASQISETRETYMSIERRYAAELRVGTALGGNSQGDEMALVGYAARFNQPSKDLGGFRETIAPGAFTRALASKPDVRCLFNHDASRVLGRTTSGTLTLEQDDQGLKFRCQLDPNQQAHRDLHAAVKRGDINECSFAFKPEGDDGDDWADAKDERGNWFISRTLKNVRLFDVSAVTHPAYDNTSVTARSEFVTPEIRGIITKLVEKRDGGVGGDEDDCYEEQIREICKALAEKFPAPSSPNGCSSSYGMYWVCETYDDYVIASVDGPGPNEYVRISYMEDGDDNFVFGTPVPVEKEWVPSERCKSVLGEMRSFKDKHVQALANEHKDQASQHTSVANDHADAAAAHQAVADAAEATLAAKRQYRKDNGLLDDEEYEDNVMSERHDVYYGDEDNEYEEGDDEDQRSLKAARREIVRAALGIVEERVASKVRTKTVGGKHLSSSSFAFVGDKNDTSTWKFPVHDADHARNALARWGQHTGIPSDKEAGVYAKIVAASKKFGIDVSETDATKAARANVEAAEERMDKAVIKVLQAHAADKDTPLYKDVVAAVKGWMSKKGDMADNLDSMLESKDDKKAKKDAAKDDRSLEPLSAEEKEDLELRLKAALLKG